MTDTPSPGASADARVHGTADALAGVTITHVDRPLSSAEADAAFQPRTFGPAPLDAVVIAASPLKPQLLSLLRWLIHGLGIWLISRGLSQGQEAALEPILGGVALSGGALGWSILQQDLASARIHVAAAADPKLVVLK